MSPGRPFPQSTAPSSNRDFRKSRAASDVPSLGPPLSAVRSASPPSSP
eukprot:CAMPEP_0178983016 /NCGR_PEP_ID=MMETSP0795-20121207/814_1 /TAXON_ID=88552 /ORGANISM="Amoebophrya sp., Strain Ameob2" /LENGTH=47 /DNA_ID= /DNA_START= /DNA_END= /DNA_ORIENTATION=